MSKILFGKKLQELQDKLDETEQRLESKRLENEYLRNRIDRIIHGETTCISGDYCKNCKNSYMIGNSMTPIDFVAYGCKLNIPCKKFDDRKCD